MIRWYARLGLALVAGSLLAACGSQEEGAGNSGLHFDKGISKRACEILTPALVAETFDVPEAELRQMKIMGCIYSWKKKDGDSRTILEANLTMLRAHETEERARTWFQNSTASKTSEEAKGEMAQVAEKAKEDESIDTDMKKEAVGMMGELMAEALSNDGYRYEPVPGIGDEARVGLHDGAIWTRVGNLTFTVSAYKGSAQPKPQFDMDDMKDLKKVTRIATEANRQWLTEKHAERKAAATKLTRLIIEALP